MSESRPSIPTAVAETRYHRALVVANPVSGRGHGERAAEELGRGLHSLGVAAELFRTDRPGDAFARLRCLEPEFDLVVAVGGDGTLREVFEGLVDPATHVGLLPLGTANVLAGALGLPRDVHHALEIIAAGRARPIDVAQVDGRLSFLVTGVGLDGMAVRDVEARRDGPISKWSYVRSVARVLARYRPPRLAVELDGERLEGEFGLVMACNTTGYGGVLTLAPDTRIDDGLFEVYLFPTAGYAELAAAFLRGVVSRLPGGAVRMRRAQRMRVTSEQPVPYQVDGDAGGTTPVELEVTGVQYHVLAP